MKRNTKESLSLIETEHKADCSKTQFCKQRYRAHRGLDHIDIAQKSHNREA